MRVLYESHARSAVLCALLPAGLIGMHLGWPPAWPALLLPVSAALFTLLWALWMLRIRLRLTGLILWAIGVHLALWVPFLFASYIGGQGFLRFNYAVFAALVTGAAVAWYVAVAHLWQTVATGLALVGFVVVLRSLKKAARNEVL